MLIRKPVAEVFEAFVNSDITTKFWFIKSSGRLEAGKQVQWEWEMYGVSAPVTVKTIEANKRIVIEWLGYSGLTTVEWIFASQKDGTTSKAWLLLLVELNFRPPIYPAVHPLAKLFQNIESNSSSFPSARLQGCRTAGQSATHVLQSLT